GAASTVFESEPPFEHNGQPFDPTEDLIRKPGPLSPELQANYQTCLDYFRKSKPLNAEDKRRVIDLYTERYILLADDLIALWDVHGNRLPLTVVKENNTEKNKQPLSRS
ncbi:MAG TPA: hypothetical protein VJK52_05380, partial [Candidatus Nanoarchaeia archaeon]|nr:hypothetical protein [Candidatus Nanoarchaeia archaeon]